MSPKDPAAVKTSWPPARRGSTDPPSIESGTPRTSIVAVTGSMCFVTASNSEAGWFVAGKTKDAGGLAATGANPPAAEVEAFRCGRGNSYRLFSAVGSAIRLSCDPGWPAEGIEAIRTAQKRLQTALLIPDTGEGPFLKRNPRRLG